MRVKTRSHLLAVLSLTILLSCNSGEPIESDATAETGASANTGIAASTSSAATSVGLGGATQGGATSGGTTASGGSAATAVGMTSTLGAALGTDNSTETSGSGAGGVGGAAANASGSMGGIAGSSGSSSGGTGGEPPFVEPTLLSETGLFSDIASEVLAPGVMEYAPAHELWSDGASKRRWVSLPSGVRIDSYPQDFWSYPAGTKLWKEFTRDGVRVETRLLHKYADEAWFMTAFEWNDDGTDAFAAPDGHENARGTEHDIPSRDACMACHGNMPDRVLGFTAVQLSHEGPGVTLDQLVQEQRLNNAPSAPVALPGNDTERAALGYFHANCGHCHNDGGTSEAYSKVDLVLWLRSDELAQLSDTPTYLTTIDQNTQATSGIAGVVVVPGDFDSSVLYQRFTSTNPDVHMPPLASEIIDPAGKQIIEDWILTLQQ
jgi:hypothetical protein